jgi:hypothetical protein
LDNGHPFVLLRLSLFSLALYLSEMVVVGIVDLMQDF